MHSPPHLALLRAVRQPPCFTSVAPLRGPLFAFAAPLCVRPMYRATTPRRRRFSRSSHAPATHTHTHTPFPITVPPRLPSSPPAPPLLHPHMSSFLDLTSVARRATPFSPPPPTPPPPHTHTPPFPIRRRVCLDRRRDRIGCALSPPFNAPWHSLCDQPYSHGSPPSASHPPRILRKQQEYTYASQQPPTPSLREAQLSNIVAPRRLVAMTRSTRGVRLARRTAPAAAGAAVQRPHQPLSAPALYSTQAHITHYSQRRQRVNLARGA